MATKNAAVAARCSGSFWACCPSVWRQCWYLVSGCAAACSPYRVRPSNLDMRSPLPRQIPLPCIRSWSSWVPREAGYTECTLPDSWVLRSYLQDDASGAPLTRLYIDQDETLFDAGQVYRTARGSLVARAPWQMFCCPSGT